MDEFAYYNSQQEQKTEFIFNNAQQVYVPDQNSGSYPNGQVVFDLASLSNSGKYVDFQNSYITVPLVMNVNFTGSTAGPNAADVFAASLKNGYHQLINSMSVEITNAQVVNLTNLSNLDIHYRLLTSCSREDELNFLPSINFHKDTAESLFYYDTSNNAGFGESNNIIEQTLFKAETRWGNSGWNCNSGRLQRQLNTSFDPVNGTNGSGQTCLTSESACKNVCKNYCIFNGNTDINHYIIATIPLKIIHDLFKKLPLTKGMYMRLILNLNTQCQSALTVDITNSKFSGVTTTSLNNVFPCMISPIGTTTGTILPTGTTKVTLSLGIGKSYNTSTSYSHPVMTSCRFYAKVCEMTPAYEEMYLSAVPTKTILYNDILSFSALSITPNGTVSQILTNGVSRPRYLIIVPQLAALINGCAKASLGSATYTAVTNGLSSAVGSPMNSPFSSSPGTTGFQAAISSLNILVSGQNIYQSNYMYGFEEWLQEVRGSNAINGGIPLGLSSGLLSQNDWENGYRFCYVDLSKRMSQANDDISRSIQVSFTNASAYTSDYFFIIGYEKQIQISTSTGALII
jgi:hypothetical protein